MTWLKYVAPFIQLAIAVVRFLVRRDERRLGQLEERAEQTGRDLVQLRKAADARRAAGHDPHRGMRSDPRNRDAR